MFYLKLNVSYECNSLATIVSRSRFIRRYSTAPNTKIVDPQFSWLALREKKRLAVQLLRYIFISSYFLAESERSRSVEDVSEGEARYEFGRVGESVESTVR